MVPLKKITKSRTSRELEQMIEDEKERGRSGASKVNHSRLYQVLMTFETDKEQVSL